MDNHLIDELPQTIPLVEPQQFVLATRDSGYRNLPAAICELVDNSLQAGADCIEITVEEIDNSLGRSLTVGVLDNGRGMSARTMARALQFGGSERFDDRSGIGRFGMGLPNSSISQTQRIELYSWQRPREVLFTCLDMNEILSGKAQGIPRATPVALPDWASCRDFPSGTLVLWERCDRLGRFRTSTVVGRLRNALSRVYRFALWRGIRLSVNAEGICAFDPLFLRDSPLKPGAKMFGVPLSYEVLTPHGPSIIEVRFSELPVGKWHGLSVDQKRQAGVISGAGVSIVRAGREVDYGWHLMGTKRRENYDDWWRCEIRFAPTADELFGVTHIKQGVNPRGELKALLGPDLETIARTLNRRVRAAFLKCRPIAARPATRSADRRDPLLPTPASLRSRHISSGGLRYRLDYKPIPASEFYDVRLSRNLVVVTVNSDHPFYTHLYSEAAKPGARSVERLDSLLLAAARADLEFVGAKEKSQVVRRRRAWSDALASFLV